MKHFGQLLFLSAVALTLTGCQIGYLVKSAYSQADLLSRRVPLEKALESKDLTDQQKSKIRLVQEVRQFAEQELGLKPTKNYTSFVQLDRPYVTYVVSAAPKNVLEHYLWYYPIVGSMPYRGYFDLEAAQEEAKELKAKNLDVHVRGVTAYSTLGWFRDPILSSMLNYRDHDLVNTIIHETVHATVFIRSHADFNERLATFIGNKGTEVFYQNKEGVAGKTHQEMIDSAHDEQLFSVFISAEIDNLRAWYNDRVGQTISEDERQKKFTEIQERYVRDLKPKLRRVERFKDFELAKLNNARLLTYRLYQQDLVDFERVFVRLGGSFGKMLEFCRSLEEVEDPEGELLRASRDHREATTPTPGSAPTVESN